MLVRTAVAGWASVPALRPSCKAGCELERITALGRKQSFRKPGSLMRAIPTRSHFLIDFFDGHG